MVCGLFLRGHLVHQEFCHEFFTYYNTEHRHSGLGLLTPESVHYGYAKEILAAREQTLWRAYIAHPERFVQGPPQPPDLPSEVWINPPRISDKSQHDPIVITPGDTKSNLVPIPARGSTVPMTPLMETAGNCTEFQLSVSQNCWHVPPIHGSGQVLKASCKMDGDYLNWHYTWQCCSRPHNDSISQPGCYRVYNYQIYRKQ